MLAPLSGKPVAVQRSAAHRLLPPSVHTHTCLDAAGTSDVLRVGVSEPALHALLTAERTNSHAAPNDSAIDAEVASWLHCVGQEGDARFRAACLRLLNRDVSTHVDRSRDGPYARREAFASLEHGVRVAVCVPTDLFKPSTISSDGLSAALRLVPGEAHTAVMPRGAAGS